MNENKILIIGEKESFIIRVLLKKLADAGITAAFAETKVEAMAKEIEDATLITFYMEKDEQLGEEAKLYLADKIRDDDKKIILIGEPNDTDTAKAALPENYIFAVLPRPLDYDEYIRTVFEHKKQEDSNELKKSILIVDDDPNYMSLIREWLKDSYKLSMANSGLRAMKWLGSNKVDLILLDYEMPVTDGPQVLEMLRADEETKDIPVIFLTGKDDKNSVMAVLDLKPEGYFLKTVGREELVSKLKLFFLSKE